MKGVGGKLPRLKVHGGVTAKTCGNRRRIRGGSNW